MTAEDARLSSTVGEKYRVVRFIAEGGMGAVYEAQHLLVRRRFAIKFLHRELAHRRDILARFTQEARAAGALEHENIAAVVDFGVAGDGTPYLVMEYLDGVDLAQLLAANGPLPSERAADLVLQAALGVQAAHEARLIHRDLKPQNLFLCRRSDGTDLLKLLDFGIAKLQTPEGAVTRTGAMLGTPAYMSPEQARGEAELGNGTDIYALGVILYELLSGRTPHPGDSHNAVIHHIATQRIVPLSREGHDLSPALVELVHQTLSTSPADRPASAIALADALRPFAGRAAWPRVDEAQASGEGPTAPARRARVGLAVAALVGLAAVIGWFSSQASSPVGSGERAADERALRGADVATVVTPSAHTGPPAAAPERPDPIAGAEPAPPPAVVVEARAVPVARPRGSTERPAGRPQSPPGSAAAVAKSAPADETGVSFDDRNPYK